ncbi:MAG: MltA domain-containing protein [Spirochaetes bacterium]|nr:MltA domain-containing protein [Spirochaetota bacterium]
MKKNVRTGLSFLILIQCFFVPLKSFCIEDENYEFIKTEFSKEMSDDLGYSGLKPAVERSISYFRKQPPENEIVFNGVSYTYSRLISSYSLFLDIIEKNDFKNAVKKLAGNFYLYRYSGSNQVLFTAYYTITVAGSLRQTSFYNTAVYSRPYDLVSADLNVFIGLNRTITGKISNGALVPYDTREKIVTEDTLHDRGDIICFVNKADLFFLQIEGSGTVILDNNEMLHLTADISNGHGFVSVDKYIPQKVLRNSAGLKKYFLDNPGEAEGIMNRNPRYVFFKITDSGSEGNIGELLTAGRSLAADNSVYPKGLIAYVKTSGVDPLMRFAVIQDTGSAISGAGRFDVFFGNSEAEIKKAENFKQYGDIYIILPVKNR